MEDLKNFVRTRGAEYLKDPNISSVGIGYKLKGGQRTGELSVQFTVREKSSLEELETIDTTRTRESVQIDGVSVPTEVIGRQFELELRIVSEAVPSDRKKRLDPITPGVSVAHSKETADTIGCVVFAARWDAQYFKQLARASWPGRQLGGVVQPGAFVDNRIQLNRLKVKWFLLTHDLDELEALDQYDFRVFQLSFSEIESRRGLDWSGSLKAADSIGESLARRPESLHNPSR